MERKAKEEESINDGQDRKTSCGDMKQKEKVAKDKEVWKDEENEWGTSDKKKERRQ